jgi:predicted DNA-binding transcriptional regulator AlpA
MLDAASLPLTEKSAFSIEQFCARNSISRALFYKMRKAGTAPRLAYIGSKPIVSVEAERDWIRAREAAPKPVVRRLGRPRKALAAESATTA